MINFIPNVRVVLVNTTHPGNIGACARAMKTMGITDLVLVNPLHFPHEEAVALAAGAADLLETARIVPTLEDAIADCGLILGTSAQSRHLPWPMLSPREMGAAVHEARVTQPVALVFGRERDGLSNEELQLCHYHVQIPTHPSCRCLNVSQAVQVLCYEVMMSAQTKIVFATDDTPLATGEQMDRLFEHLEETLEQTGFLDPRSPKMLIPRLRRLFMKAHLDQNEMNILRGVLSSVDSSLKR
jgi:tRNA (cytidine32/uridine32-2'-O)-methyltransferase